MASIHGEVAKRHDSVAEGWISPNSEVGKVCGVAARGAHAAGQ